MKWYVRGLFYCTLGCMYVFYLAEMRFQARWSSGVSPGVLIFSAGSNHHPSWLNRRSELARAEVCVFSFGNECE